ncbi:putative ATP synthase 24 kDa subunit, mitochondrial [Vitis vinifera]|uniref:Putative ATP synthase 24 kDa subunit, mitochondrial n=1 Tax=Vitis vinifera TaxID=29760 RepID=A0A438KJM0_VITVI|nr:putative ATP synthase 24 kDa subunit, mitochondrial [Vitis vinifera]
MAFSSRLLSKSKQLYGSQIILQQQHAVPVRFFAKEAAPPALKGDEMLKNIFLEVKKKFETAMGVLRKEKITIDPEDPAAVNQYAKVMKTVREKADLFSESQRIQYTIQTRTQGIPDARTYLLTLKEIRIKRGLTDELGAEAMMMDALEKVEKELKKPLMRNDKKGMALLMAEFDKVNKKIDFVSFGFPLEGCPERGFALQGSGFSIKGFPVGVLGLHAEYGGLCLNNVSWGNGAMSIEGLVAGISNVSWGNVYLLQVRLGVRKEDLPKYEEQLELKIAKAQLEELKKDALEAMETQKKREEFKDEAMVDVKSLDIRNFI